MPVPGGACPHLPPFAVPLLVCNRW